MFDNIGGKIKGLAKFIAWLFLIAGVITFILMVTDTFDRMDEDEALVIGIISLVTGVLSYFGSWILYGFGQLIEDTETIKEATVAMRIANHKASVNNAPMNSKNQTKIDSAFCVNCGAKRDGNSTFCISCGQRF